MLAKNDEDTRTNHNRTADQHLSGRHIAKDHIADA